jgi:serine phosphatase RsbU (regulator of sigma subunit)
MAHDARTHPTRTGHAKRLAPLLLVICLALGLAIIPTANARRDRTRHTGTRPASGQASETTTGSTSEATTTSTASTPQGSTETEEQGTEPLEAAASTPAATSKSSPAHKRHRERERHKETESTRSHEGGKRSKSKATQPSESPSAPGTPTPVAPAAPQAVQASVATASTPPAPTSATTSATPGAAAPKAATVGRSTRRGHRPAHRLRHDSARQLETTLAASAGLGSGATSAAAKHSVATQPPRPAARGSSKRSRPSPLVTTITRIVGVVPTPVRLLIAALLALALLLAMRSRVAAVRARRLQRQRGELLEDVGLLQAALLPVPPARLGPVGTTAAYQPAAGPGAGGDFYDVFALEDGQLAVIVGDVSGHGRQALPHTALVRFTLRAYLEAGLSPRDAVQTAGAVLERQLGGVFATLVAATYQPRERVLSYACAGHPPPVVLGAAADAQALAPVTVCTPPPIGVGMRTGTRQTVVSIPGHAQICFYTDGVTEARVGSELFGARRLLDTLVELGPRTSASALLERVAERADARPDDMAACLLGVEGEDLPPKVLVEELELDREEAASERTARFLQACGVARGEVADVIRAACAAAGRAGTVVLELHLSDRQPRLVLRREHLSYLHARRADVGVAR